MIKRNTNLKIDREHPFLIKPTGKDYLWAGSCLRDDFFMDIGLKRTAY